MNSNRTYSGGLAGLWVVIDRIGEVTDLTIGCGCPLTPGADCMTAVRAPNVPPVGRCAMCCFIGPEIGPPPVIVLLLDVDTTTKILLL